jgi:hypothetical protein
VIEDGGVARAERIEPVREREHDVDVRDVEELPLAGRQPPGASLGLTLRTVPVPTRVVRDGPMSTRRAVIEMSAERRGPAPRQRAQHGALLHTQPAMLLDERLSLRAEEIGHLHGRPTHACGGFRSNRERGTTGGGVTCSCSSGIGAACKCRRDKWR